MGAYSRCYHPVHIEGHLVIFGANTVKHFSCKSILFASQPALNLWRFHFWCRALFNITRRPRFRWPDCSHQRSNSWHIRLCYQLWDIYPRKTNVTMHERRKISLNSASSFVLSSSNNAMYRLASTVLEVTVNSDWCNTYRKYGDNKPIEAVEGGVYRS